MSEEIIGRGVYAQSEAARLIGLPTAKLSRWVGSDARSALWRNAYRDVVEGSRELSFRDLQQARTVWALRSAGVSLQAVRKALVLARELIAETTPFAHHGMKTDGRRVFLHVAEDRGEPVLIDLLDRQYAFDKVLGPVLDDVDFEEFATRWWPNGRKGRVVLDPDRSFGRPIDAETGVPTSALAVAVDAEGSVRRAARSYEVPEAAVRHALAFEAKLAA